VHGVVARGRALHGMAAEQLTYRSWTGRLATCAGSRTVVKRTSTWDTRGAHVHVHDIACQNSRGVTCYVLDRSTRWELAVLHTLVAARISFSK
jgi:hypothetical protein